MSYLPNIEQKKAIEHKKGPMLVIAGAGTGKTSVIIERIKYLILNNYAKPEEILGLTFTEKAANEMMERIDLAFPLGLTNIQISTFHSFCDKTLKDDGIHIGLGNYSILSTSESIRFFRNNIFEFDLKYFRPLSNPNKFIEGLLSHFSRLYDEAVTPLEYKKFVDKKFKNKKLTEDEKLEYEKYIELSSAFEKYEELKIKNNYLDFGDLINKTIELFEKRPNILLKYKNKYKYGLVDEFQDTNYAQNRLLNLLYGPEDNLTIVGDDDQSIYKFRGGNVGNILNFTKFYKSAEVVVLNKNYRSSQNILDLSYKLIQNNNPNRLELTQKIDKKLISQVEFSNSEVMVFQEQNAQSEAKKVCEQIINLVHNENYDYKDIAILVRANNHASDFVLELEERDIPYQILGVTKLFNQKEIFQIINFLKLLVDIEDSQSFYQVLSINTFEIPQIDLIKIMSFAKKLNNISIYEALEKIEDIKISNNSKIKLIKVKNILENILTDIHIKKPTQVIYEFLSQSGLINYYLDPKNELQIYQAENIKLFFEKVKKFENDNKNSNIFDLVNWIDLQVEFGDSPMAQEESLMDNNSIKILTVHSAKGLEFRAVFVVNLVALRFPSIDKSDQIPIPHELEKEKLDEDGINEERRLMYVAITRAREKLYLTAARNYGGKTTKKISQFVFEMFPEFIENNEEKIINHTKIVNLQIEEKKLLKSEYKVDVLSYSKIDTFKTCPLHFKLKYILNIPTASSASLNLGNSVHNALFNFYSKVKNKNYSNNSKDRLIEEFKSAWIDENFVNKKHAKEMFVKGKEMLSNYYDRFFDENNLPISLEIPFKIPLVKENEEPLKIVGKIDRIDSLSNDEIEIIDYKTGDHKKNQKEVDSDLQLTIYALASMRDVKKIKLSLLYLDDLTKITTTRTKSDIQKAVDEIFEWRKKIEESDFECSNGFLCKNCEFRSFCNK